MDEVDEREQDEEAYSANLLDLEAIAGCFRPDGAVHKALGHAYEFREQQVSVACEVASAFNENATCLLEAPTGIGKTFAYLVPAARWALMNDEKVVISTGGINLQSQIINKDMAMIRLMLGDECGDGLRVTLVKGWGNYICRLRAEDVRLQTQQALFDDEHMARLLTWERTTEDGSRSDLTFTPSEEAWAQVSAESASCVRKDCPHYAQCFFFQARAKIANAHLLVVNHDLLFSHLQHDDDQAPWGDTSILPLEHVVMDEAHNVVDTATRCFSVRMSNHGIQRTIRRLDGVVPRLATLAGTFAGREKQALLDAKRTMAEADTQQFGEAVKRFFDSVALHPWVRAHANGFESFERRITATDEERWGELFEECHNLKASMGALCSRIETALSTLDHAEEDRGFAGVAAELKAAKKFLEGHIEAAGKFSDKSDGDGLVKSVRVEKASQSHAVSVELAIAPLDIVRHLKDKLYEGCQAVIMTSATLRVEGRFDFQRQALGVEANERFRELAVPSPFDYGKQALFAIATDLPEPSQAERYVDSLAEAVLASITAAGGGALVLFTAHDLLRKISHRLSPRLTEQGITPLTQGEQSRERLLEAFIADSNSALFATDSFREGVDVVGDALRLVIITKLPFNVPTEPVFEARKEAVRRAGNNAFSEYAVPLAVISFRQAFGRLIRATTDRGAVIVLDSRIDGKPYGRRFRASVPPCRTVTGPLKRVIREVEALFRRSA